MDTDSAEMPMTYGRDELTSDLRDLVQFIETLHADPFLGYDSRSSLHARVERLARDLPEEMTAEAFYRLAASVVSGLEDAHSLVRPPEHNSTEGEHQRLPLSLEVVGTGLYVESVTDESLTELVGARLSAIEGVSASELVDRSEGLRGAENRYGALLFTAGYIERYRSLARLLDRETPPETLAVEFELNGARRSIEVNPVPGDPDPVARLEQTFPHPEGTGPRYRMYEAGHTMVFVPGNLLDYRESLEAKLASGADITAELASEAYDRQVGEDPPDSVEATVAVLPSMTETLEAMAEEMVEADSETLIVDLRGNSGGDSQFVFHLAYLLDGWDGVARAVDGVKFLRRRTEPYRQRYGDGEAGSTLDNPADYDFSGFFASADQSDGPPPLVERLLSRSKTATEFVERHGDGGLYAPERVVVVVSAGTMSSAFAGAAQLSALGADVVGVPSGQAPISFGEPVEQRLPNTGLEVRIAGSMFQWLEDPVGDVLEPDCELTPARFEAYDRARDAALRLAFEYAGYGDSPPTPIGSG